MLSEVSLFCRVCGYESEHPPWGGDGKSPIFDFCPCCGVEHGYQDATPIGARNYRAKWLRSGAKWEDTDVMPDGWDVEEQLVNVPCEFQ